jgi:hypothetical protein
MADFAPGTLFAGHRIEAVAGRGGMGVVYRATQLALDRVVALKVVAPDLVEDATVRARFLRESKIAASLEHPHVLPIYYAGEEDGVAYIAMRYVEGDDLRSLVRREGALPPARAARIVAQVASALDAAHAAGLVHRDVKPANVLLGPEDHVYLTDFGLTKHALSMSGQTREGQWVGTLDYVAPEQIRGERVDARADVYALGCVLVYALTGAPVFRRDRDEAKLWAHLSAPPDPPSARGVPAAFDAVVLRALAKRPEERQPSAGDLGRAALAAVEGRDDLRPERVVARGDAAPAEAESPTISATRPAPTESQPQEPTETAATRREAPGPAARSRRRPALVVTAAVLVLGAAGAALALTDGDDPPGRADATPTATATPAVREPTVAATITVGQRPNAVAAAGDSVWVGSFRERRLARVDPESGRDRRGPVVGEGTADMAAGGGSLYVAVANARRVVRIDPASGRVRAIARLPREANTVDHEGRSVWVGEVTAVPGGPDALIELDARTLAERRRISVPEGVQSVRATRSSVWVLLRRGNTLVKYDARTGQPTGARVRVGDDPQDIALSPGAVWVTNQDDNTVMRVDSRTTDTVLIDVPSRPVGIQARGRDVWVASRAASTLTRIDARTLHRRGEPVEVGVNPYALAVTASSVWVTGVGDNSLTRVDY